MKKTMLRTLPAGVLLLTIPFAAMAETAWFTMISPTLRIDAVDPLDPHEFVFAVTDADTIQALRNIVLDLPDAAHTRRIEGRIVRGRAAYNPAWNFHLDPSSIRMQSNSTEICDASAFLIEDEIEKVGTDFLPDGQWCPWTMRVLREVKLAP